MSAIDRRQTSNEREPLLGRPGDVEQLPGQSLLSNLIKGTAPLAQFGGLLIFGLTWGAVFTHRTLLFSAHPLLNALAILLAIQAILVLQPTHTPEQKKAGTTSHAAVWAVAGSAFFAGLIAVEVHKQRSHLGHFESPHAVLGLVIYVMLMIQILVGVTQYYVPAVYGSVDNAKAMYKYHRVCGYIILTLVLINVVLASKTPYAGKILGIKTWATVVGAVFVLLGILPRIKKKKVQLWGRRN
ncbi:hypothetical protein EX30DRAFT_330874 [Ascodesmis nigricans]|uniref:Cytochrome b561 domain-containing protein n=1 Tax=Ascodesmis nigricans TaxID=341454 RepID=A0A4S2MYP3_9PEZI|nr:hypothetical protein EX30DRAFT_330874 [Ascodesmis nigricans]